MVALNAMMFFSQSFAAGDTDSLPAIPKPMQMKPAMNEQETKAVLASFGLPVVEDVTCISGQMCGKVLDVLAGQWR